MNIPPACAGKTATAKDASVWDRDHPRLRGKDVHIRTKLKAGTGSPPLTRERPSTTPIALPHGGITPANAGKTRIASLLCQRSWDHPRLRGKDFLSDHGVSTGLGSPPLARERRIVLDNGITIPGITPAYAGKTEPFSCRMILLRDHPRLRGKNQCIYNQATRK